MEEQLFCSKCGKTNWSEFAKICECRKPNFIYKNHHEFLESKKDGKSFDQTQ